MPQERTRKIVITAVLGAISIFLGWSRWGFIPWFGAASLTILHIPAIIGAILEGPVVGLIVGAIFGLFSMIQASIPNNIADPAFINPLVSVLPRIFIGPAAWLVWKSLKRWPAVGLIGAGLAGSLTNTILVIGVIGLLGLYPWALILPLILSNGLPEAGVSAVIVLAVVSAWWRIPIGKKQGSSL
ncbi:MAG TPA: ECF transporter S component [Anaerolineaceae bacterium]|nr:ECF transporter S component [Anaerolineaceae bacterium]